MASGTYRVQLTPTPQRIDNLGGSQNLNNAIKLLNGQAQFWYLTGAVIPAVADRDKGYPKTYDSNDERANELTMAIAAADSLWASGTAELVIMAKLT